MDVLNDLLLQAAASPWLIPVMFAVAVLDAFFPPVPSETVLVGAAAVAAATGDLSGIVPLALAAGAGAVVGDNLAYALGRRMGVRRFRWMRGPRVSAAFARAGRALEQRGAPLILGARYIPIGRVAVNMSAGALGYPWRRFLPLSLVAAASWAAYGVVIGTVAGRWVEDSPLLGAAIGVVLAVTIGLVVDRVVAGRRRRTAQAATDAGEAPVVPDAGDAPTGPAAPADEDTHPVAERELCDHGARGLGE